MPSVTLNTAKLLNVYKKKNDHLPISMASYVGLNICIMLKSFKEKL